VVLLKVVDAQMFLLKESREVVVEANIDNQYEIIIIYQDRDAITAKYQPKNVQITLVTLATVKILQNSSQLFQHN
jgi:hypothetical protein